MKSLLTALSIVLASASFVAVEAEAARVGGGRSAGIQRNVTPPAARPSQPAPPARQAQPAPQTPQAAAPASGLSRWLPALGGLALGGLLGSMFGGGLLGGGLAGGLISALLIALLVGGAFVLVRAFLGRNSPSRQPAMQYSGFGAQPRAAPVFPAAAPAAALRNVPNVPNVPAGFDQEGFLRGAKMNFIKLQVANDARDLETLRELTTPSMFDNLESDIRSRPASQQTDVVSVDADLLELVEEGGQYVASVRFAGMVRESVGTPPAEFSEVWHLVKPIDGSGGWLLAGIQQD